MLTVSSARRVSASPFALAFSLGLLVAWSSCSSAEGSDEDDVTEDDGAGGDGGEGEGGAAGSSDAAGKGGAGTGGSAAGGQAAAGEGGNAGGASGAAGGGGGSTHAGGGGGAPGTTNKSMEHVWFDKDVTLSNATTITDNHPVNWFSPVNYWEGQIQVRLKVQTGIAERFGVELCMWKASADDPKHTCPNLIASVMGTGEFTRTHMRAGGILLNILARGTMVEDDFKTGFVLSKLRLIKDHNTELPGPVAGRLTVVLVPKGLTFSGWANY